MRCPSCGAVVETDAQRFCQTCGAPLDLEQLRQQQAAQTRQGTPLSPQLTRNAQVSLTNIGDQVNRAIATRNTGQLIVYAVGALVVWMVASAIFNVLLGLLPIVVIVGLIYYMRRGRRSSGRRW